ncbi:MAG: flagellar hook-length control protein FliK [Clostridiales bacterium]|nr:flagellar hook-length control protein FliK [Clostridiales bacterium]
MQNIAVQMTNRRCLKDGMQAVSSKQKDGWQAECTDPFLQIVLGMIAQLQETADCQTGNTPSADLILPLLQNLQDPSKAGNVLEILALSGFQGLQDTETGKIELPDFSDALKLQLGIENMEKTGEDLADTISGQVWQTVQDNFKADEANQNIPLNIRLMNLSESGKTGIPEITVEKTESFDAAADSGKSVLEDSFRETVAKVKEMLYTVKSDNDESEKQIDVDSLQNEISKSRILRPLEFAVKSEAKTSAPEQLSEQIKTGIKQNLSIGKSEFTIRLKPEALGEITVKIVEEAGKATLSITAASARTARLINSDIAALREAVAPMNVHVNEAVMRSNAAPESGMQQFFMAGQQFAGQQFAGQRSFAYSAPPSQQSNSDEGYLRAATAEEQSPAVLKTIGDRLDAYI